MKIYKCSWPNGTFSIVHAKDKLDAIFILDEWGSAEESMLKVLKEFAMDFNFDPEVVAEGVETEAVDVEDDADDDSDYFDRTRLYKWSMSERTADEVELLSPLEVSDHIAEWEELRREQDATWEREKLEREGAATSAKDPALN